MGHNTCIAQRGRHLPPGTRWWTAGLKTCSPTDLCRCAPACALAMPALPACLPVQLFTGITGFILALFFMIAYVAGIRAVSSTGTSAACMPASAPACACLCPPARSCLPGPPACPSAQVVAKARECVTDGTCRPHLPPTDPPHAPARSLPCPQVRGILSLVLDFVWTIFWLAAAACVSSLLAEGVSTSNMKASVA